MKTFLRKILRYLHPFNRIRLSFELYDASLPGCLSQGGTPMAGGAPAAWNFDRFGEEIKDLIAKGKQAMTARLQVIGLERLESHFGGKWPKVVANVHGIVQLTLKKHLSDREAYAQVKDNAYIILFSNTSEEEARARCKKIRDEIHAIFIKETKLAEAALSVKTDVREMDPMTLRHEAAEQGQMSSFAIKQETLDEVMLPNAAPQRQKEPGSFDLSGEGSLPPGLEIRYRPIVDTQTGAVTAFACVPWHASGEGYAVLAGQKNNKLYSELDRLTLDMFQKESGKKPKTPFICPVHFNSVGDATNNSFLLQACPKLTAEQKQQLMFEFTDVPVKLNEAAIKVFIDKLKPFCKSVIIRSDIYGLKKNAGSLGISFLSMDIRTSGVPEATIAGPMAKFTAQAKEHKLKAIAYGALNAVLVKIARDAGISMIGGDAVHPLVADVGGTIKIALPE